MKFPRSDLGDDKNDEQGQEYGGPDEIAEIHGHRYGVAGVSPGGVANVLIPQKPNVTAGTLVRAASFSMVPQSRFVSRLFMRAKLVTDEGAAAHGRAAPRLLNPTDTGRRALHRSALLEELPGDDWPYFREIEYVPRRP